MNNVSELADESKFKDFLVKQFSGIKLLYENQLAFPTLTLIYSTIDILGYVWAGGDDKEAGIRFRGFVDTYIIKHVKDVNSYDLWGARCAILHTATPESTSSKKGAAREILYSWGSANHELLNEIIKKKGETHYVALTIEDLFDALGKGIDDFLGNMEADDKILKQCMTRVKKFYAMIPVSTYPAK